VEGRLKQGNMIVLNSQNIKEYLNI
jgi:hypothetical protein